MVPYPPSPKSHQLQKELQRQGIKSDAVLQALLSVPREEFVPDDQRKAAYRNAPLPIGMGQTISQPLIVARMAELLEIHSGDRILEIGTGSGYAAAVLSLLAAEVFTIERHRPLAVESATRLKRLGFLNVHVRHGDGTLGWPNQAPFDGITVAASGPQVPSTLLRQLRTGGRLVMPVGKDDDTQELLRVTRRGPEEFVEESMGGVRFVPLIGREGWPSEEPPVDG